MGRVTRGRRALPLLAACVVATLLQAPAAAADPADLAGAREQASALRSQVEALEEEVERAAEDHSAAVEELGALVSAEIVADTTLSRAQAAGAEQRDEAARRARALYKSGGRAGVFAGLLDGGDLGDVVEGLRAVRTLMAADTAQIGSAEAATDHALASSTEVQELRAQRQTLELAAAEAAARAEKSLAEHTALLDEADADLVALALDLRRQEEAAALARAGEAALELGVAVSALEAPAPTQRADAAVQAALGMLGTPYQWGATGPGTFDCSGLTSWAYRQAGVTIPRTSRAQYAALPKVPLEQLAPGDLVFWAHGSAPGSIHHVGIYVGGGKMVHAPRTGDVVKVSALWSGVYGAARPVTSG